MIPPVVRDGRSWYAKYGIGHMIINIGSFWGVVLYICPLVLVIFFIIFVEDIVIEIRYRDNQQSRNSVHISILHKFIMILISDFLLLILLFFFNVGYHALDMMIWKPTLQEGELSGLAESLLAGIPDVKYLRELIVKPYLRSQVQTDTIGSVIVNINTITNGFEKYGVGF